MAKATILNLSSAQRVKQTFVQRYRSKDNMFGTSGKWSSCIAQIYSDCFCTFYWYEL